MEHRDAGPAVRSLCGHRPRGQVSEVGRSRPARTPPACGCAATGAAHGVGGRARALAAGPSLSRSQRDRSPVVAELRRCEEARQSVLMLEKLGRISMAFVRASGPDRSEQRPFCSSVCNYQVVPVLLDSLRRLLLNSQDSDLLWWEILAVGGLQVSSRLTRVAEICESGGVRMRRPQPSDRMTLRMGSRFGNPAHLGPVWDFPVWAMAWVSAVAQAPTPGYVGRPGRGCYRSGVHPRPVCCWWWSGIGGFSLSATQSGSQGLQACI